MAKACVLVASHRTVSCMVITKQWNSRHDRTSRNAEQSVKEDGTRFYLFQSREKCSSGTYSRGVPALRNGLNAFGSAGIGMLAPPPLTQTFTSHRDL
jgi:hypothetical protein